MSTRFALAALPLLAVAALAQPAPAVPDLETTALGNGPYSRMRMLLEKTIFSVDVLTLEVQFDATIQQQFRKLAAGGRNAQALVRELADVAMQAEHVYAELRFERDVSLNRWLEGVRGSLELAWRAGLIAERQYREVSEGLPRWFAVVAERGFRHGDRILYRGYPDRLRTVLVSAGGEVMLDQTDRGEGPRRTLLAGYFAPGSDFREPLVRSLLQP